jgi:hypothetical protein
MSIRMIWITIRAVDYASQVFGQLQKNIGGLIQSEGKLAKQNEALRNTALKAGEASLMMFTLSSQLAGSLLNMAMASREGAGEMARLKQQIFLTNNALNNAAFEFLKVTGVLTFLSNVLNAIQKNRALQFLVIGLLVAGTVITAILGIILAYNVVTSLAAIKTLALAQTQTVLIPAVIKTGFAFKSLAASIGAAVGFFGIFFMIASSLSGPAKTIIGLIGAIITAIIALIVAQAAATGGLSTLFTAHGAALGIAAGAGLGLATGGLGSFDSGTQSVQKTGPIFAHKGEVVYNPSTNRPLQIGNDMGRGGSTTNMNTQITIENIHTKADYDDVAYQINKANRSGARSVR